MNNTKGNLYCWFSDTHHCDPTVARRQPVPNIFLLFNLLKSQRVIDLGTLAVNLITKQRHQLFTSQLTPIIRCDNRSPRLTDQRIRKLKSRNFGLLVIKFFPPFGILFDQRWLSFPWLYVLFGIRNHGLSRAKPPRSDGLQPANQHCHGNPATICGYCFGGFHCRSLVDAGWVPPFIVASDTDASLPWRISGKTKAIQNSRHPVVFTYCLRVCLDHSSKFSLIQFNRKSHEMSHMLRRRFNTGDWFSS